MDLWKGNCYVHVEYTQKAIERIKIEYPEAKVVAHPECTYAVRLLADEVCSTERMISYCKEFPFQEFIIVLVSAYRLRRVPSKVFILTPPRPAPAWCRFMKMNTLGGLRPSSARARDHPPRPSALPRRSRRIELSA